MLNVGVIVIFTPKNSLASSLPNYIYVNSIISRLV